MEVVQISQKEKWNSIVKSFSNWDVYYLNEYAKSFELHGDGIPVLINVDFDDCRMIYIMMENDISEFLPFQNLLEKEMFYDWTSPYGYGGPLIDGNWTVEWMQTAMEEVTQYAKKHHIVSQFFRYHPLLQNHKFMETMSKVIYMKKTVYIDTSSEGMIKANMTSNNRNTVRKAEKNGIKIIFDSGERMDSFIEIYNETMKCHEADTYYYFQNQYFDYLRNNLAKNMIFGYALYEEKIISASIFLYNELFMHYHLSGTLSDYRNLGAANLILTEAAFWAEKHGISKFHLGGGVEMEDSLLNFKKRFNKNGLIDFCIGCNIFLQNEFDFLVESRKKEDKTFDGDTPFLIKYRG